MSALNQPLLQFELIHLNGKFRFFCRILSSTNFRSTYTIVAEDGKLSQRQLLQIAERLFNRPIKSPSTKLNQARERKKDNAVFLENLKGHFQAYSQELDEKQRKRR